MFTKMINLSPTETNIQLYKCADETVQNTILNNYPEFFNSANYLICKLLDMLEALVEIECHVTQDLIFVDCTKRWWICPELPDSTVVRHTELQLHMLQLQSWSLQHIHQGPVHSEYNHWCATSGYADQGRVTKETGTKHKPWWKCNPDIMHVKVAATLSIVELEQVTNHVGVLPGVKHALCVACKTTSWRSASWRTMINEVAYSVVLRMRKPPWMFSLSIWYLTQLRTLIGQPITMARKRWSNTDPILLVPGSKTG